MGDIGELAELVRAGTILNEREREFAANFLLGKIEPLGGRPKNHALIQEICLAFFWLHEVDSWKKDAATERCKEIFNLSRGQIIERRRQGYVCAQTQEVLAQRRVMMKFTSSDIVNYFRDLDLKSG